MRITNLFSWWTLPCFGVLLLSSSCSKSDRNSAITEKTDPEEQTLEKLPSSVTGITFSNNITETHEINIVTNAYMYNGGGVAVLDFNNDGLQDLYFTSSQEDNKLYQNKGNFVFEDVTEKAGVAAKGGYKTGVTVVDINNDGFQDIYVCRTGLEVNDSRRNLFYLNKGDGTFTDQAKAFGLDDASASNHINFFDYDLDGDLDAYLLNHPVDFKIVNSVKLTPDMKRDARPMTPYDSDRLFRNDGGKFTDVTTEAGITNRAFGLSVTVGDINGDRYPDIYVGNDYIEPDRLLINNGNGTFTDRCYEYMPHTSNHTMGVDIGDINNDGLLDIASLDMLAEENYRQKTLMTTMMYDRYTSLVNYGYGHQVMRNNLQLNTGLGHFSEIGCLTGMSNTDWSWAVLFADLDNDTNKDVFITNGYRRDVTNLDYLNYTVDSINHNGGINKTTFPDFNDYLKMVPTQPLQNYLFKNKGQLQFEKKSTAWGIRDKSYSNGAAYADLDNDGDLELIVNNIAQEAFVYKNISVEKKKGNFLQIKAEGDSRNIGAYGVTATIYIGDQIQTQYLTPVRGFLSSVQPMLHFGLGKATMVDKIEIAWPTGETQTLTQVKGNQVITVAFKDATKTDLAKAPATKPFMQTGSIPGLNFVHKEDTFVDFKNEILIPHKLSTQGPYMAVGDVNGDKWEDVYIGGAGDQAGQLFLQAPNGSFRAVPGPWDKEDYRHEDLGVVFVDVDGDKDLDLYVVSGGNGAPKNSIAYQDRLYINDGRGAFAKSVDQLPTISQSGECVIAADYDQDGDMDIMVGGRLVPGNYPIGEGIMVLNNNKGKFTDVSSTLFNSLPNKGMITDIAWTDLGTGPVLVTVGEWMPLTIYAYSGGTFKDVSADWGVDKTNGWWNCVAIGDFDGDGDKDIVAGNMGLNSRLKASEAYPLLITAADFDQNGQIDPVLGWSDGKDTYPLPLLANLLKELPSLKKSYVRHEPYGKTNYETLLSKVNTKDAVRLKVTTFETTYFENKGKELVKKALPIEAQFSQTNDILAADLDKDGQMELILIGNHYGPDVETGRYDASTGLVLKRNKDQWQPIVSRNSGLVANKEARQIKSIQTAAGKTWFLVSNNNDKLQSFQLTY